MDRVCWEEEHVLCCLCVDCLCTSNVINQRREFRVIRDQMDAFNPAGWDVRLFATVIFGFRALASSVFAGGHRKSVVVGIFMGKMSIFMSININKTFVIRFAMCVSLCVCFFLSRSWNLIGQNFISMSQDDASIWLHPIIAFAYSQFSFSLESLCFGSTLEWRTAYKMRPHYLEFVSVCCVRILVIIVWELHHTTIQLDLSRNRERERSCAKRASANKISSKHLSSLQLPLWAHFQIYEALDMVSRLNFASSPSLSFLRKCDERLARLLLFAFDIILSKVSERIKQMGRWACFDYKQYMAYTIRAFHL